MSVLELKELPTKTLQSNRRLLSLFIVTAPASCLCHFLVNFSASLPPRSLPRSGTSDDTSQSRAKLSGGGGGGGVPVTHRCALSPRPRWSASPSARPSVRQVIYCLVLCRGLTRKSFHVVDIDRHLLSRRPPSENTGIHWSWIV